MPDLHAFGVWLLSILLYIPQKIIELLTDALLSLIDTIFAFCTICDFSGLGSGFAALPSGALFVLGWFKVGTGLTLIVSAYIVRFLIRRLPFVG
jgi:hypothetical protein